MTCLTIHVSAVLAAIIIDVIIGDPHGFWHPVRAVGALVSLLDERMNGHDERQSHDELTKDISGALLWITVTVITVAVTAGIVVLSYRIHMACGFAAELILTYYILAAGSLRDESMKVYEKLQPLPAGTNDPRYCSEDLNDARRALSMIVGRDTATLDREGIIRATIETVAENTSDGVIAPLLYTVIGGPVLGMCYKAVNTMDSMIGYHNDKYEHFGRFAARADDIANYIPSRLSAIFVILASGRRFRTSFRVWRRDRLKHMSPNSAQTESAFAGALGLKLGGGAYYNGVFTSRPYIGDEIKKTEASDIIRAIRLMFATEALCTAAVILVTVILIFR